jgi:sulfite reductase alpha subunit-like flavoprotein
MSARLPPVTLCASNKWSRSRLATFRPVSRVTLDISGTGIRYQPGDRCAILPENDPQLVELTLEALRATGDEPIPLNAVWRTAVQLRDGYQDSVVLSLRTLLTFGRIRPVMRAIAKSLYSITSNEKLHHIIEARAEDQWELWDVLNVLAEGGFNPKRLWKATLGEREHITRIVPPETFRTYSISSIMDGGNVNEMQLTIGGLHYQTKETPVSRAATRTGTGSSFLGRVTAQTESEARRISIKIIHPPRFSLPADARRPVVMFAGGTGIAPFRSMLQARVAESNENWLFFGTRTRAELYYQNEWMQMVSDGRLHLRTAFSQEDTSVSRGYIDAIMLTPEVKEKLWELIEQGAYFYVCGRTGFAKTVMTAMQRIIIEKLGEEKGT